MAEKDAGASGYHQKGSQESKEAGALGGEAKATKRAAATAKLERARAAKAEREAAAKAEAERVAAAGGGGAGGLSGPGVSATHFRMVRWSSSAGGESANLKSLSQPEAQRGCPWALFLPV